jgi:hypothetical protein
VRKIGGEKGGKLEMREKERRLVRRKLDEEMRPFRRAAKEPNPTSGLLRAARHAVGIPLAEVAGKRGVVRSTVLDFELRELEGTITLRSLARMAGAMGCKVVYGVVPMKGRTFEDMAEERLWRRVLGEGTRD